MARTPSLTLAEAESLLGPRGYLNVSAANRGNVRKWLTAHGLPAQYVVGLAMKAMQSAYNDTSDRALNDLRRRAKEGIEELGVEEESTTPAPQASQQPAMPQNVDAGLAALRALLGGGGIDENRVRDIVRNELPNLIPVTRIEIVTPTETKSHGPAAHHKQLPQLIRALSAGLHVALVGPAGSGKTTAAEQAAKIVESRFFLQGAIQGAHELLGYKDAHGVYHRTPMRESLEHGGVLCMDELDAGDAAGLLVANSATANGCMPFPDSILPVSVHAGFRVVACMNTFGNGADRLYVGRNQMDAATLDRFVFINWHYDETLERTIAGNDEWTARVQSLRAGAAKEKARVVISPRASINGAKLLAAGETRANVEEMLIWKGMDNELRRRIESHV